MSADFPHDVFKAIHREHEQLRATLKKVHHAIAAAETTGSEIALLLNELQRQLQQHFFNEEQDGFFDEITAQAPRLIGRADGLCTEHVKMLGSVSDLARFASVGAESEAWRRELDLRFQVFSQQLMQHESEENTLLHQAYQEDIGTHD